MIPFSLLNIIPIIHATLLGKNKKIKTITIDSRYVSKKCLFIALKGKTFDAHNFVEQAINNGAEAILVDHILSVKISQLIVTNTHIALGQLGAWVRQQVSTKIVALTGSSGKTSVKEMTASILREHGQVLATHNNYNNNIGVPLTLLRLTPKDNFAVIELGANNFNEIKWTTNLTKPDIALINNISISHITGFKTLSGVSKAKEEIFTGLPINGQAIINYDSHNWSRWKKILKNKVVWRFALNKHDNVNVFASNIIHNTWSTIFTLHSPQGDCTIYLPIPGIHNVSNALAASTIALIMGATLSHIMNGLAKIHSIPGRLFPIHLDHNKLLIDDSYNANINSVIVAAQLLANMPGYRVMVIGELAELGMHKVHYYHKIGKKIKASGIDKVLSIGQLSYIISDSSNIGKHFLDKLSLVLYIIKLISGYPVLTLLIKGSRNSAMEQIIHLLQEKLLC